MKNRFLFRRTDPNLIECKRPDVLFCFDGVQSYFDVPEDVKKVWFTLHERPAADRIRLVEGRRSARPEDSGYWFDEDNNTPWSYHADKTMTILFPKGICYVGCEYEC